MHYNASRLSLPILSALTFLAQISCNAAENPFLGRWALQIADNKPGWLQVEQKGDGLAAGLLWIGGSVIPADEVTLNGQTLTVTKRGKNKASIIEHTVVATRDGEGIKFDSTQSRDGKVMQKVAGTGVRLPELPNRPDLSKVNFAKGIPLIGSNDLSGWKLVSEGTPNGWTVKDGLLSNRVSHDSKTRFGNIQTAAEFGDFKLDTEVRTLPKSNSGIYLRGLYEIQIAESFGQPADSHHMGALYSRITPKTAAEKAVGEWQTLSITLVDLHLTVVLNGQTIIDNEPVLGCTGGAMKSQDSGTGPIMLQGDHSDIDYKNMILHPVQK